MNQTDFSQLELMYCQPFVVIRLSGSIAYISVEAQGVMNPEVLDQFIYDVIQSDMNLYAYFNHHSSALYPVEFRGECSGVTGVFTCIPVKIEQTEMVVCLMNVDPNLVANQMTNNYRSHMKCSEKMISSMIHDMNNAVGGITGTLSLINFKIAKGGGVDAESMDKYAGIMGESVQKVSDLLDLLGDFTFTPESMAAAGDINDVLKASTQSIGEEVTVTLVLEEAPQMVHMNPSRIKMAIDNLLRNAVYSMNEKKESAVNFIPALKVSSESRMLDDGKEVVEITIRDNGVGIDPKIMSTILYPFVTTKPKGAGKGLSLTLANHCIIRHGGQLFINSKYGEWAEVKICLPMVKD